ncbi:MAG: Uncharacterized protein G01um101431_526, partial [Parcubacteria group bacterium Gr01-1014_31]
MNECKKNRSHSRQVLSCALLVFALVAPLIAPAPARAIVDDASLRAFWPMNETAGTVLDETKANLDITMTATPGVWNFLPASEGGVQITGNPDAVGATIPATNLINAIVGSNAFTVDIWFVPADTSTLYEQNIMTIGSCGAIPLCTSFLATGEILSNFYLRQRGTALTLGRRTAGSSLAPMPIATITDSLIPGTRYYLAYAESVGGGVRSYTIRFGGISSGSGGLSGDFSNWDNNHFVNLAPQTNKIYNPPRWKGKILQLAIYDRELNLTDITENYDLGNGWNPCVDGDSDGYGNPGNAACANGAAVDCDDRLNGADGVGGTADDGANINPGATERCDLLNNDCNAGTTDGSGDAGVGVACDGTDTDLCSTGDGDTTICSAGAISCGNQTADNDVDLCNGTNNTTTDDCNAGTADGAGETTLGNACDGTDTDLCNEGTIACTAGALS